jgi:hypothetical protein
LTLGAAFELAKLPEEYLTSTRRSFKPMKNYFTYVVRGNQEPPLASKLTKTLRDIANKVIIQ